MRNLQQIVLGLGKIKERIDVTIVKRLDILQETAVLDVNKEILDRDLDHLVVAIEIKVGQILVTVETIEKGRHKNIVETAERDEIAAIAANPEPRVQIGDTEMKKSIRLLNAELIMIMIEVSEFLFKLTFLGSDRFRAHEDRIEKKSNER